MLFHLLACNCVMLAAKSSAKSLRLQPLHLARGQSSAAQQAASAATLASDIFGATGMARPLSGALRRQASDAAVPNAQPQVGARGIGARSNVQPSCSACTCLKAQRLHVMAATRWQHCKRRTAVLSTTDWQQEYLHFAGSSPGGGVGAGQRRRRRGRQQGGTVRSRWRRGGCRGGAQRAAAQHAGVVAGAAADAGAAGGAGPRVAGAAGGPGGASAGALNPESKPRF